MDRGVVICKCWWLLATALIAIACNSVSCICRDHAGINTDTRMYATVSEILALHSAFGEDEIVAKASARLGEPTFDSSRERSMPIGAIDFAERHDGQELPRFKDASRVVFWKDDRSPIDSIVVVGVWFGNQPPQVFRAEVLPP